VKGAKRPKKKGGYRNRKRQEIGTSTKRKECRKHEMYLNMGTNLKSLGRQRARQLKSYYILQFKGGILCHATITISKQLFHGHLA